MAKVELATEDGTVVLADIAGHTFAVQMAEEMDCVRQAEENEVPFSRLMAEARTEMSRATIRAYDDSGVLLHEGPSISSAD